MEMASNCMNSLISQDGVTKCSILVAYLSNSIMFYARSTYTQITFTGSKF